MKLKMVVSVLLLAFVSANPVYGADAKQGASLWERLRFKIEQLTPKKKIKTTTAVGGVRGSQVVADDVYWKNEAKTKTETKAGVIDDDELASFKKALGLVDAGDVAGAQTGFAEFLKQYPDSRLRKDAEMALEQLQAMK
jgi:TolA-binding protein